MRGANAPRTQIFATLRGHEFVPSVGEIFVFVHDRVPYSNSAHAVFVRTTVTYGAHFFHELAERAVNIDGCWLSFKPEVPLCFR